MGLWASTVGLSGFLGIVLSGALVQSLWPGSVFVLGAVLSVGALATVRRFVPDSSDRANAPLDPLGSLFAPVGIAGLVLALTEGPVRGWDSATTVVGLVAGVLGVLGFCWWEPRRARPPLDVRLLLLPGVSAGAISIFVSFLAFYGLFFLGVQYLSYVRGYGAFLAAVALLPVAVSAGNCSYPRAWCNHIPGSFSAGLRRAAHRPAG